MPTVRQILSDPVTKHMRRDPARLRSDLTAAQALDYIHDHEMSGRVVYFYVVDADDKLVGVLPTRRPLRARREAPITDVMIHPVIAVPDRASVLEACEFFPLYRFLAFPVVSPEGRLVGLVDVDLYTEELEDLEQRQEGEDLFQLVGVHLSEAEQRKTLLAARKRFPWLMCNAVGGMIAALIADAYSDVATLVLVTPFIALVTGMAEGVTIQSVSLALQTMHGRRPTWNGPVVEGRPGASRGTPPRRALWAHRRRRGLRLEGKCPGWAEPVYRDRRRSGGVSRGGRRLAVLAAHDPLGPAASVGTNRSCLCRPGHGAPLFQPRPMAVALTGETTFHHAY